MGDDAENGGSEERPGTPGDPVHFRLLNEIGIVAQLSGRLFERVMPGDMTLPQFTVLNHFVRLGRPSSPARLASAFQVTKGAMTNTLGHLEAKGFVTVCRDPADGRSKIVDITPPGRAAREEAVAALAPSLRRLADAIPGADIEAILPVLVRLRAYLDAERDGPPGAST